MPSIRKHSRIRSIQHHLYVHRYFASITVGFALVVWIVSAVSRQIPTATVQLYDFHARIAFGMAAAILLGRRVVDLAFVEKETRPLRRLAVDLKRWLDAGDQVASLVIVMFLIPWFHSALTCFKTAIPLLKPFCWDARLAAVDRWLHFGYLPSDLSREWLGNVWVTFAINVLYNVWLPLMFGFIFWQAFQVRRRVVRMQFLLTYAFAWIAIGSGCATLFSSGGPCFFGQLAGTPNPYAEHFAWLHGVDQQLQGYGSYFGVWALDMQQVLWECYTGERLGLGSGISAMPSMHLAIATLMAATAWQYGGWMRWVFVAYLVAIQIGSVHLGWHYAIDGYVSVLLTCCLWKATEPLARQAVEGWPRGYGVITVQHAVGAVSLPGQDGDCSRAAPAVHPHIS